MHPMRLLAAILLKRKVNALADMATAEERKRSPPRAAWRIKFGFLFGGTTMPACLPDKVHSAKASTVKHVDMFGAAVREKLTTS